MRVRGVSGLGWASIAAALFACAPERRATGATTEPAAAPPGPPSPAPAAAPRRAIVPYPNGDALLVDPGGCAVARFAGEATVAWARQIPRCSGQLVAAVAPNSYAYVRSSDALIAFTHDGTEAWRTDAPNVPAAIATPAAMPNSTAVAAVSPRTIVAHAPDGQRAWSFDISGSETLTSAPRGSSTEGLLLVTEVAVYAVTSHGELRWRTKLPGSAAPVPSAPAAPSGS